MLTVSQIAREPENLCFSIRQLQKSPQIPVPVRAGMIQTHSIPRLWEKDFTLTFSALTFSKSSSPLGVPVLSCPSLTIHSPHFLPPISFPLFPCLFGLTRSQVMPWPVQSLWLSEEKMHEVSSVSTESFYRRMGVQGSRGI